jgi:hypothetical protein
VGVVVMIIRISFEDDPDVGTNVSGGSAGSR